MRRSRHGRDQGWEFNFGHFPPRAELGRVVKFEGVRSGRFPPLLQQFSVDVGRATVSAERLPLVKCRASVREAASCCGRFEEEAFYQESGN